MIRLVEEKLETVEALCRRFHVARLELFGSATGNEFDEARSDLDFLVEFQAPEPGSLADAYFGLLAELERLFKRKVDLATAKAIKNPYFLRAVNRTRRMLYAA